MGLMKVYTAVSPVLESMTSNNVYLYTVSILHSTTKVSVDSTLSYIGRLAFASCSDNTEGCTENVTASFGTISLNATLYYIPGGSCGYRESITNINVILKNLTSNRNIFNNRTSYGADQVQLTRGMSRLEIVPTLLNVDSVYKSGRYEVKIEGNHPGNGKHIEYKKTFHLNIQPDLGRFSG